MSGESDDEFEPKILTIDDFSVAAMPGARATLTVPLVSFRKAFRSFCRSSKPVKRDGVSEHCTTYQKARLSPSTRP